ncbi:MAG: nucleoside recognition protein [Lachnospiraceae bacterium]|nr:nucleoside recognition protein [Lachnospiraceae bacterium]
MINYLWGIMIISGMGYAILTGHGKEVGIAAIDSSKEAIELCIAMLGVMGLWMGLMQIAIKSGIMKKLTQGLNPVIKMLFPTLPADSNAREYITSNFVANILGLGWAATPVGLKAMKELKGLNNDSEEASIDMCTFLIINISSLQLIPINVITYRSQYGSANPSSIIGYAIIATAVSTLAGVLFSTIARKISSKE